MSNNPREINCRGYGRIGIPGPDNQVPLEDGGIGLAFERDRFLVQYEPGEIGLVELSTGKQIITFRSDKIPCTVFAYHPGDGAQGMIIIDPETCQFQQCPSPEILIDVQVNVVDPEAAQLVYRLPVQKKGEN